MKYIANYTCIYNIYWPNMNFMSRVTQWHGTMVDLESTHEFNTRGRLARLVNEQRQDELIYHPVCEICAYELHRFSHHEGIL